MPQLKILFEKENKFSRRKVRIFIDCFCFIGEICVYLRLNLFPRLFIEALLPDIKKSLLLRKTGIYYQ
jgi:hypothetical protein